MTAKVPPEKKRRTYIVGMKLSKTNYWTQITTHGLSTNFPWNDFF